MTDPLALLGILGFTVLFLIGLIYMGWLLRIGWLLVCGKAGPDYPK